MNNYFVKSDYGPQSCSLIIKQKDFIQINEDMDHQIIPSKEQLEEAVGKILKDCNRCIYKWSTLKTTRYGKGKFNFDYDQVRSLFITWITRHMRRLCGYGITDLLIHKSKPVIQSDPGTGYIINVVFAAPQRNSGLTRCEGYYKDLISVFETIDYSKYFFIPDKDSMYYSGSLLDHETIENPVITSVSQISFEKIENLKFEVK